MDELFKAIVYEGIYQAECCPIGYTGVVPKREDYFNVLSMYGMNKQPWRCGIIGEVPK